MRTIYADLHLHSTRSDGHDTPAALVRRATAQGLQAIALTDHDTVLGVADARAEAERHGVRLLTGTELSVSVDGEEVHLLAYGFDPTNAALRDHLTWFVEARAERAQQMVAQLQADGVPVTMDDVTAEAADGGALGRPHVAAALASVGAVDSVGDAFEQYLTPGAPGYVGKPAVPAADALDLVHDAGGVGVLAHPGHWTPTDRIHALIRAGLDGIEVVHPSHDPYLVDYYRTLADRRDLLATGGSDYHGRSGDDERLGRVGLSQAEWERVEGALT